MPPWALAVLQDAREPFVTCRTEAPVRRAAHAAERPAPPAPTTSTSVVLQRSDTAQSVRGSCKNGGCERPLSHGSATACRRRAVTASGRHRVRVLVRERALRDPLAGRDGRPSDRARPPPAGARAAVAAGRPGGVPAPARAARRVRGAALGGVRGPAARGGRLPDA